MQESLKGSQKESLGESQVLIEISRIIPGSIIVVISREILGGIAGEVRTGFSRGIPPGMHGAILREIL